MWQPLLELATGRQAQMDRQVDAWCSGYRLSGGTVHCAAGCSGCCTLSVNCTFPETLAITKALRAEQRKEVAICANDLLAAATCSANLKAYLRSKRTYGACPLLNCNGFCSIYPSRPLACRSLISTRESRWCTADFGTLTSAEKQAFMADLDRRVVDFPLHYAAFPREVGQEGEQAILGQMCAEFGFAVAGELPYLIWLEAEHNLSLSICNGHDATKTYLEERNLLHPFLVRLLRPAP